MHLIDTKVATVEILSRFFFSFRFVVSRLQRLKRKTQLTPRIYNLTARRMRSN